MSERAPLVRRRNRVHQPLSLNIQDVFILPIIDIRRFLSIAVLSNVIVLVFDVHYNNLLLTLPIYSGRMSTL